MHAVCSRVLPTRIVPIRANTAIASHLRRGRKDDPYADPAVVQARKQRWDNLTAYGVALGIFEDDMPKEDWEPQNSEEDETMRHGRRLWSPAQILDDVKHHPDSDEDSSYDNDYRAVPEVSMEEFQTDPVSTWRKFRREAERPGHISSHRSAYRRLPQYLKDAELDRQLELQRMMEWEEEKDEQSLRHRLRQNAASHEHAVHSWLKTLGVADSNDSDDDADACEENGGVGGEYAARQDDDDVEMERGRGRWRWEGERERDAEGGSEDSDMKKFEMLSESVAVSLCGLKEAEELGEARARAVQKLLAYEERVKVCV